MKSRIIRQPPVVECFICKMKIRLSKAYLIFTIKDEFGILKNCATKVNFLCSESCLNIAKEKEPERQQQLPEVSKKVETGRIENSSHIENIERKCELDGCESKKQLIVLDRTVEANNICATCKFRIAD